MFHGADFLFQSFQVFCFGVVGFQVAHSLNALLNPVGAGHLYIHRFLIEPFLHLCGEAYNGKGNRQYPQRR